MANFIESSKRRTNLEEKNNKGQEVLLQRGPTVQLKDQNPRGLEEGLSLEQDVIVNVKK